MCFLVTKLFHVNLSVWLTIIWHLQMPHQMKASVVCQKNQRETVAPSLRDCMEWVLLLEVIITFALPCVFPPVKIHGVRWACAVQSWKAFCLFQLLQGLCLSSRSSSWSRGMGTRNTFKPFTSDLSAVIWEVPLLTPVPHQKDRVS